MRPNRQNKDLIRIEPEAGGAMIYRRTRGANMAQRRDTGRQRQRSGKPPIPRVKKQRKLPQICDKNANESAG